MENLLPENVGSIINYMLESTEVTQWGTPSCSRPKSASSIWGMGFNMGKNPTMVFFILKNFSMKCKNVSTLLQKWQAMGNI